MPVLTVKAVVAAGSIENCQVAISMFSLGLVSILRVAPSSAAWTKPPTHTIGRQIIIIPLQNPFLNRAPITD
jgi:hypothetical protein